MTKSKLLLVTAACLALSGTAFLGCPSAKTQESTGEYLDNSVITTKVKAALLNDPSLKSFEINVKSFKDVVQLSGFVDTAATVQRAGALASSA